MNLKKLITPKAHSFSKLMMCLLLIGLLSVGCQDDGPAVPAPVQSQSLAATTSEFSEPAIPPTQEDLESKDKAQDDVQRRRLEKQREIVSDASAAIDETYKALELIAQEKSAEALAAVEKATGKLEVVLAREPGLALAPVAITESTQDLLANPSDVEKLVEKLVEKSIDLLKNDKVQQAREILETLASETVISTTNLPLETYPNALKQAAKHIDQGELEKASSVLNTALSTQVITEVTIPLPLLRAQFALEAAEALVENSGRTDEENKALKSLLNSAEKSVRLAKALGYGSKSDFKVFFDEIKSLQQKTSDGKSGTGFFDKIKKSLESLRAKTLEFS